MNMISTIIVHWLSFAALRLCVKIFFP